MPTTPPATSSHPRTRGGSTGTAATCPATTRSSGTATPGPWNAVARDGLPVALIDWEFAGPVDAIWELAHATWLNAQLHDDDVASWAELPDADTRLRQAGLVVEGYGLPTARRADLVDKMIAFAVFDARAEAVEHGVGPETTSALAADGYPVQWAVTWRTRSAAWMLRHRHDLERRLGTRS